MSDKPFDGRNLAETFIKELDLYMSHKIAEERERKTPGMSGRSASIDRSRAKLVKIFEVIENACYAAKVR